MRREATGGKGHAMADAPLPRPGGSSLLVGIRAVVFAVDGTLWHMKRRPRRVSLRVVRLLRSPVL